MTENERAERIARAERALAINKERAKALRRARNHEIVSTVDEIRDKYRRQLDQLRHERRDIRRELAEARKRRR